MASLTDRFPFLADLLRSRSLQHAPAPALTPSPGAAASRANTAELEEARGAAMRRLFPKLSLWCASRREAGRATEVYEYLRAAANVTDLEQRIRAVEKSRAFGVN